MNDLEFLNAFESGNFPPSLFDHGAHLRLAWINLKQYGEEKAIENVCQSIRNFDALHGDGSKFHTTLTVASIKTVNHFMQKSKSHQFADFIREFPRLKTSFKELLNQHYGFDLFFDPKAKNEYVAPDLLPF
ncbi:MULTISPECIES: hypothetical protein [Flagellimonas]|uniref:Uncharacterized protein n=1 Tax=Flagellimonas hadalis TaxID=2597517 RepID=A0A5N5J6K2_9FLAO|nr:hypothetical protein [Allomuricauda hadalis]KAB5491640.1 hypothetical protein FOT42_001445 [Allomuricauda hadalis]